MLVRLVMSCFWLLLGIINGVILANRVTPFTGPDLRNLSDGAKVVTKYLSKGTMILVVAACGIIGIFCMGLDQRTEISGENPLVSECAVDCSGNCTLYGSNKSGACKACAFQLFRQHRICYQDYGYPYCLAVTLFDTGISEPNGYSEQLVKQIETSEGEQKEDDTVKPNIIFLSAGVLFRSGAG